jgi:hypothetical protein
MQGVITFETPYIIQSETTNLACEGNTKEENSG